MPAGEEVGVGTDREDRNRVGGMRVGRPADMCFLVEQGDTGFAERVHRLIHVLGIFGFAFAGFLIKGFELFLFVCRNLYLIPEAETLTIDSLYLLPRRFLIVFEELGKAVREYPCRTMLVLEQVQMERIIAVTKRESAGLMVGGDDDEGLVRMSEVEIVGYAHCLVHIPYFTNRRSGIVAVAGIIDHTAFDHHKEPLVTRIEEGDGGGDDLRKGQVAGLAVDGVGEVGAVGSAGVVGGLDEDEFRDHVIT